MTYKLGTNQQLEGLWLKFHTHEKGIWVMPIEVISQLVHIINNCRPTQILELGTGIGATTACLAANIGNGRITTVEQNQQLIELAKELIPHDLKQKINFEYAPAVPIRPVNTISPFQMWSCYDQIPWSKWDFIIIDGPGPFLAEVGGENHLAELPNGDLIWLLPKIVPGTKIFVQGRKDACKLYKRFLGWYLDVLIENEDYCLFERTKEQLNEDLSNFSNSDISRSKLMDQGYFK